MPREWLPPLQGGSHQEYPPYQKRGPPKVPVPTAFCEGVIRGFYPIGRGAVRKTGDGEIPRQTDRQIAGGLTGRDGQKAGGQLCNRLLQNYESCPGGSGQLARSTWLSWGVFTWRQVEPEQPASASGQKTRR